MIRILFICPGGQSNLNSPSENLAKYIDNNFDDISIDIYNQRFKPVKNINASEYDVIWGDMDGNNVPSLTLTIAKKYNKPCYIHGEWVPPYRFENGWTKEFNEPTNLGMKNMYLQNIKAMQSADVVSLALSDTPGGFDWLKKNGFNFKNNFVRYPASKLYPLHNINKKHQVATIARVNDGKKRVQHNISALLKLEDKPTYKVIGGTITHPNLNIESLGSWNNDDKVKIYSESKLALQHWSGIPPAEAIQQLCPVISYDIPYMRELYSDALIWVEKDNIDDLADKIDYWLSHDKERKEFAINIRDRFLNGEFGVKLEIHRANLVVNNIKKILKK
jgi:glycosyltransferase involved in cell wall biosynthesis